MAEKLQNPKSEIALHPPIYRGLLANSDLTPPADIATQLAAPAGARTGMPVMPHGRPYKSHTGPCRDLKGQPWASKSGGQYWAKLVWLTMGCSWACPYGAHTGFPWGLLGRHAHMGPVLDWIGISLARTGPCVSWCPVLILYGIRLETLSGCLVDARRVPRSIWPCYGKTMGNPVRGLYGI